MNQKKIYQTAIYIRISALDSQQRDCDTIETQKNMLKDFIEKDPSFSLIDIYIDNGKTGVNFKRDGFKRLLEDINKGKINCIIVKDLSRFGRNYIEVGRYLEQIFPALGVRFISINDGYDSNQIKSSFDDMRIPLKNLMNDAYSRDISMKVRSQIKVRCMKGEYIGIFPVYGYFRSKKDKHKLEIDDFAAMTVKDIFRWKIEGYSNRQIANHLNMVGMLSPLEYKRRLGFSFYTSFQQKQVAKWSSQAVDRILKNEVYIGTMVQGKESSPNYKIKKKFLKPKSEWIVVEHTHKAIIPKYEFDFVKQIMQFETKIPSNKGESYLCSGSLECGSCHNPMIRKSITSNQRLYSYYICRTNKKNSLECSDSHRIREEGVINCIQNLIKLQILTYIRVEEFLDQLDIVSLRQKQINRIELQIQKKKEEYNDYQDMLLGLFKDYQSGILEKEEYEYIKEVYEISCTESLRAIKVLEDLLKQYEKRGSKIEWIEELEQEKTIRTLNRFVLITFIKKIVVIDSNHIQIHFRFQEELKNIFSGRGDTSERNK